MKYPITLKDAVKTFTGDQDKVVSPEQTLATVREKFRLLDIDILKDTVRIDNGRLDIPVYFSVCGRDAARLTGTAKQMGKGATPVQAETSAVMELVERFSFYHFSETPDNFIVDTLNNLKDRAMPFDMIARSVHDTSADLAIARDIFASLPLRWTPGFNLTTRREMLVPFDWFFAINEFNGTSAGNCVEEALCQGICEIVERHVSAIVCREKKMVPGILLDSAKDPVVREMIKKYGKNKIQLYASDFSLDMGIPTVGVMAWDPSTFPEKSEIVWTAGTCPDPEKAFSRALSETAQLGGDFNTGSCFVASGLPKYRTLEAAGYITHPDQQVSILDLPDISDANIRVEVENTLARLSERGFEVITVATTHPRLGIPAFYTMIPGAHFRERAAATSVGMFSCKLIVENNPPAVAVRKLADIAKRLPRSYYVPFYQGLAHLNLEDPEAAYRYFVRALELNPHPQDLASVYSYMGVCLKDMGDYESALNVLEKGAAADDERTDIYNLMGFCRFMRKEHEQAIRCFERVIALNPSSAIDYANIASNYRDMGDTENAIAYYQIALSIDPSIAFARTNLEKLAGKNDEG